MISVGCLELNTFLGRTNQKKIMKSKYQYFIVCNCNQPIMFDLSAQKGYWMPRNNPNLKFLDDNRSDFSINYLTNNRDFKTLEVTRREFRKFVKSKFNRLISPNEFAKINS